MSKPVRIAIFSSKRYERDFLSSNPQLTKDASTVCFDYIAARLDSASAHHAAGADAVCAFVNDNIDAKTLQVISASGTKCVLLRCAGFNQVDLVAAKRLGVTVLRVPAYSPYAVAEFACALLLTVARKTHKAYNRTRESNFSLAGLMGFDVHGKTVGICGTGKIGRLFASIMRGFGVRIVAYDIYPSQAARDLGVEYVSMDELLRVSDVISLHCPLLPSTRHMIDAEAIGKMKKGVVLINTSRGELVDMDALIEGLQNKTIGSCGMDVVEGEAALFFDDHSGEILEDEKFVRLMAFPNVLITPHLAFCTDTAMMNIWSTTIQNMIEFMHREDASQVLTNQVVAE